MSANYRNPNWLLPNEKNLKQPASGTVTGSGLAEDRKSLYSMNFDGINDYIRVDGLSSVLTNQDFTLSLWFKGTGQTTTADSSNMLFSAHGSSTSNILRIGIAKSSGGIYFAATGSSGSVVGSADYDDSNWYHLVITKPYVSGGAAGTIYINGSSIGNTEVFNIDFSSAINYSIGQEYDPTLSPGDFFKGNIDEVAIWNKALSAAEVAALATASAPANLMALSAKPLAYWPLGEFAGNSGELGGTPSGQTNSWKFPNQAIKDYVFDFDGGGTSGGDYITLSSNMLANKSKFSWSGWIKFSSYPSSPTNIYGAGNGYAMQIYRWQNKLLLQVSSGNSYSGSLPHDIYELQTNTSSPFNNSAPSKWYHIAIAWQGNTTSGVKAWIDGVETDNSGQNTTISNLYNGTANWDLGNRAGGSPGATRFFDGQTSNVLLWDELIDDTDVQTLYNNGSPLTRAQPKESNLLLWWKLNAATSSYNPATSTWTITDSAGSNNGTSTTLSSSSLIPSDLQFESPYSNFSLDFDGSTSYINCGNDTSLNWGTGNGSVSCWFKTTQNVTGAVDLVINGGFSAGGKNYALYLDAAEKLGFAIDDGDDNPFVQTTNSVADGNWHHAVGTREDGNIKIYLDGSLINSTTDTTDTSIDSTDPLIIGAGMNADTGVVGNFFDGKIDEVSIFNSALTATQVNQVYNNGRPGNLTSLSPTSWWRLGEDAFFVNNDITIPNQISGGPTGTGSGTQTAMLSADAPKSYGGGYGVGLAVTDKTGDAPNSTANSLSYNMIPDNRHPYIPGYVPAKVDNNFSMSFNGTDGYYNISPSSDFTFGSNGFAISMWVKRLTSGAGYPYLIDFRDSEPESTLAFYYNESTAKLECWISGVAVIPSSSGTKTLPLNDWAHVVLTREGTTLSTFVDGELDQSVTNSSNLLSTTSINVGRRYNSVNYFEGNIDEIAIFNYGLTPKQIKEDIYNASTTGKTADLSNNSNLTAPVAWYRMGD